MWSPGLQEDRLLRQPPEHLGARHRHRQADPGRRPATPMAASRRPTHAMAWSPDSRWLVYPHYSANHLHALMLYSLEKRDLDPRSPTRWPTPSDPAFDRNGKYLYFLASNNAGATRLRPGHDHRPLPGRRSSIYALALKARHRSPVAPEARTRRRPAEAREKAKENADATPAGKAGEAKADAKAQPPAADADAAGPPTAPTVIDLAGLSPTAIAGRIVALPLPAGAYSDPAGRQARRALFPGAADGRTRGGHGRRAPTLNRYVLEDRKGEKLAERVRRLPAHRRRREGAAGPARRRPWRAATPRPADGRSRAMSIAERQAAPLKPGDRRAEPRRPGGARRSARRVGADVPRGLAHRAGLLLRPELPRRGHRRRGEAAGALRRRHRSRAPT